MSDQSTLYKETNARFWAQYAYKPGHKLDPNDPADKAMMPAWMDIFAKVKAEDAAGALHLSYNNPEVKQHLTDAAVAHEATLAHLDAAAKEPDPAVAAQHDKAAQLANLILLGSAKAAQKQQLPSASPDLVNEAAKWLTAATGLPPAAAPQISPRHPAASSPSAKPVTTSEISALKLEPPPPPPVTTRDHHAIAQVAIAPQVAADSHHGRAVASAVHPRAVNGARAIAKARRAQIGRGFVGFAILPDGHRIEQSFATRDALRSWYESLAQRSREFAYIAMFEPDVEDPIDLFGDADVIAAIEPQLAEVGPPPAGLPPVAVPSSPAISDKKKTIEIVAIGAGVAAAIGLAIWAFGKRGTVMMMPRGAMR